MTHATVDASNPPTPYGWDWSATTHAAADVGVYDLVNVLGADRVIPGKGLQGWPHSLQAFDDEGYLRGSVYFGGGREDLHVLSTSAAAEDARWAVTGVDPDARTARVDTRVDTLVPFDDLARLLDESANTYGAVVTTMESRRGGESLGRTVYLGAPTSAVRVRLYEKWLESPGQYVEGTNRVEVQLRPASRVKGRVTSWEPSQTFCASRTTQHLARALGADLAPAASLHIDRGTPDLERTLEVMGEQYGPAVERWLAVSGGDLDTVIDRLTASVTRQQRGPERGSHAQEGVMPELRAFL